MDVKDYYTLDPILEQIARLVRRFEQSLGPEDDWVEDDRRILFEAAQRHLSGLHTFVYEMGTADYVFTVDMNHEQFERLLLEDGGYNRNLMSARKYREHHNGGKQWATGSYSKLVTESSDNLKRQHHVFIFPTEDGRTDVYAHEETSTLEGAEHLVESKQERGAAHKLPSLLDQYKVKYTKRETLK